MKQESANLADTVIAGGYCIGCGACAVVRPDLYTITLTPDWRQYQAVAVSPQAPDDLAAAEVCPFSHHSLDETAIGGRCFAGSAKPDPRIGFHRATFAGHALAGGHRERGSSGGLTSWFLSQLLSDGTVDAILHVRPASDAGSSVLFEYAISRTAAEISAGAKSRYYPVEMSNVLRIASASKERFAIVGVPCFIKAARLLMLREPALMEAIRFTVAIFCGHLKSARFAEYQAWECGVAPQDLVMIDFRKKLPERHASDYGVEATSARDGIRTATKRVQEIFGSSWGNGFFKYNACDYCDDVVGECADIAFGDAWLDRYELDSMGTNVVIARTAAASEILQEGAARNQIHIERLTPDEVVESQAGGFRHRREGLAYRLHKKQASGEWYPRKRVEPGDSHLSSKDKSVYDHRIQLAQLSHLAFHHALESGDLEQFHNAMRPLLASYNALYHVPRWRKWIRRIINWAKARVGMLN